MHRIVLCADDYGLSPGVSRGIRELVERGRLTATSCMTVYPEFDEDGAALRPHLGKIDIGLHFTLTAKKPVGVLLREAYFGGLNGAAVAAELERQLATFMRVMGRAPDYIDGHQHVQLLPGVREHVVATAKRIGAYVRSTREPIGLAMGARPSPVEAAFLSFTAGPLQRLLAASGVRTNKGFRGPRTFREAGAYRALFQSMIAGASDGSIVMCHPGYSDAELAARDGVTAARGDELRYFAGEEFPQDLAAARAALSRL